MKQLDYSPDKDKRKLCMNKGASRRGKKDALKEMEG
jgi:hypothetical protein